MAQLAEGDNKSAIPLEVKAQNAGILISRKDTCATFEFFELSPDNKSVMFEGRLVRSFPGLAANMSISTLREQGLQSMLASTISKMSTQVAPGFQPQARKAGRGHDEERDTTHPGMVTDYLLNVITALGDPVDVARITKNTREEILWDDTHKPWQRSPMWLMIRVTLQLHFTRQDLDSSTGKGLYKSFIVHMFARLLSFSKSHWSCSGSTHMHVINAKIHRRVRKLENLSQLHGLKQSWVPGLQILTEDAFDFMDKKWKIQAFSTNANFGTEVLKTLRPKTSLDAFLRNIDSRKAITAQFSFEPAH